MINRNGERAVRPSFLPKFSDPDIFKAVIAQSFWSHVFLGEKKALWMFFKGLVNLKVEMFASPLRMVLRYDHGRRTVGVAITLMSATMMMAFNTRYVVGYLATFFPFAAPVIPFFLSGEDINNALFLEIRSPALMYCWMGHVVLSTLHLVRMHLGMGGTETPSKRGSSWLYLLVFKHAKVPEAAVQGLAEPLLAGATGYFLMSTGTDATLGFFLVMAATCLLVQEAYDAVMRFSVT